MKISLALVWQVYTGETPSTGNVSLSSSWLDRPMTAISIEEVLNGRGPPAAIASLADVG